MEDSTSIVHILYSISGIDILVLHVRKYELEKILEYYIIKHTISCFSEEI